MTTTLPPPTADEVHLWLWHDDPAWEKRTDWLAAHLTVEEQARSAQIRRPEVRRHSLLSRAVTRRILAAYLGLEPHRIQLVYAHGGKPALARGHRPTLSFNVSHSHGHFALAITERDEVGLDVEHLRGNLDWRGMARRFFHADEVDFLSQFADEEALTRFFCVWTGKEAYLKAKGRGIAYPLDSFAVPTRGAFGEFQWTPWTDPETSTLASFWHGLLDQHLALSLFWHRPPAVKVQRFLWSEGETAGLPPAGMVG